MSDDIDWISVTTLGSEYEQEVSRCGRFQRHRPFGFESFDWRPGRLGMTEAAMQMPWRPGPAPDGTGQGNPPRKGEPS